MENKKIRNATPSFFGDIKFKSQTEKSVFRYLLTNGYNPMYEPETFVCWKGFTPTVPFFNRRKVRGKPLYKNVLDLSAISDVTYTPDIIFMYEGIKVIIEVKGFENDVFPLKKKLFRQHLETLSYPVVYAEIFTLKQLKEFLSDLKTIANKENNGKGTDT